MLIYNLTSLTSSCNSFAFALARTVGFSESGRCTQLPLSTSLPAPYAINTIWLVVLFIYFNYKYKLYILYKADLKYFINSLKKYYSRSHCLFFIFDIFNFLLKLSHLIFFFKEKDNGVRLVQCMSSLYSLKEWRHDIHMHTSIPNLI